MTIVKKENSSNKNGNETLTVNDVAKIMRVHRHTVRKWIQAGELQAVKVAPCRYALKQSDLVAFIEAHKTN